MATKISSTVNHRGRCAGRRRGWFTRLLVVDGIGTTLNRVGALHQSAHAYFPSLALIPKEIANE